MHIVTIDSGTTNTRVRIWQNYKVVAEAVEPVGVRDTAITKSTLKLLNAVKSAFNNALNAVNLQDNDNLLILASGMITSNVGLCDIPHISAPVSFEYLAQKMVKKIIPEISKNPIWFIPGVKNTSEMINFDNYESMDVMRGEETEVIGILSLLNIESSALIILPGSHSKFVKIENDNIVACATTMAGELIDVLTDKTIISSSLDHQFVSEIDEEFLFKGMESCNKVGLTRSCFLIRILDLFANTTINQRANFLLGAIISSDISSIKKSTTLNFNSDSTIVITGKKILCEAFSCLIKNDEFFKGSVITKIEEKEQPLSGLGAIKLAQKNLLIN